MAISFVSANTQDSAGAQSLTFTIPAGAQTDDFMVCFVKQSENTGQQTWDDDGGGGNGWTREDYHRSTGGRDQETAIYWKIHSGSESNPTFTWDTGGTNEPMSGALLVYRGVDTIAPFSDLSWMWAQNDGNPPNPSVNVDNVDSWVICFHAATHDDISSTAPPTGFTMRAEVYGGSAQHTADHRDLFAADINNIDGPLAYSPPDWQHSVANTTPEYHTYTMALNEQKPIGVTVYDTAMQWGQTNKTITGYGFGATQGSGTVEIWSDLTGTTQVAQTIDSWSDTSIQFDLVRGALSDDTTLYLVVTNNSAEESAPKAIQFGLVNYHDACLALNPDHWWTLDGNYSDTGVGGSTRDMTSGVVGTHPWVSAIAEDATQAMQFNDVLDRREIADSPYMNITISSQERTVGGWIQLGGIQQSMGAIWKEGGGVQNLAFITGLGNVLMAQLADVAGSRDNVQATASIRLTPDRPYHIALRYSHSETTKEMRLFLDGEEQPIELTDGNPMTLGIFDSHSGDVTWGDPDNNLETGGTDIAYAGQEDCIYQHWYSWSDNSAQGGALDKTTEIRDVLFRRGAPPAYTISADTQANMQSDLDTQLQDSEIEDWPLGIRVEGPSSGGPDLTLTANGVTFNSRTTMHVEWRGIGTLTWIVGTNSDIDESKIFSTKGGSVVVERPATLTVNGLINGSEVRLYDDNGTGNNMGTELDGVETLSGTTFQYSHSGATNDIIVQMIADGYIEIQYPFQLNSNNQSLTLFPIPDLNA
ncbi:MAG: hypothetical protein DBP02_15135 [gamma proteobacterium symbiont of Ctena orbiculata]|nr:MAG: hypothetical protein DBP02_15135 [gamma proteobacterium symbiont of Ctena orbiculata]